MNKNVKKKEKKNRARLFLLPRVRTFSLTSGIKEYQYISHIPLQFNIYGCEVKPKKKKNEMIDSWKDFRIYYFFFRIYVNIKYVTLLSIIQISVSAL